MRLRSIIKTSVRILVIAVPPFVSLQAATITWDGSCTDQNWEPSANCTPPDTNWDLDRIPAAGDDVIIPDASGITVISSGSKTVSTIQVTGNSGIAVNGGNLTVNNASTIRGLSMLNARRLIANGIVTLEGSNSSEQGILSGLGGYLNNGDLTPGLIIESVFINQGGTVSARAGVKTFNAFANNALFILYSNAVINSTGGRFNQNAGTLEKRDSGTASIGSQFEMLGGRIHVKDGQLNISGGTNAILFKAGEIQIDYYGIMNLNNAASMTFDGLSRIYGDGYAVMNTPITIDSPLEVSLSDASGLVPGFKAGNIRLNSNLTNRRLLTLSPGVLSGTGTLINERYALLNTAGVNLGSKTLNKSLFLCLSSFNIGSEGFINDTAGTNRFSGSGGSLNDIASTNQGTYINKGLAVIDLFATNNKYRIDIDYNQEKGLTRVDKGILEITGGGSHIGGEFNVTQNSVMHLVYGQHSAGPGGAVKISGRGVTRIGVPVLGPVTLLANGSGFSFEGDDIRFEEGLLVSTPGTLSHFSNRGSFLWSGGRIGGTFQLPSETRFSNFGAMTIVGGLSRIITAKLSNYDTILQNASISMDENGLIDNLGTWTLTDTLQIDAGPSITTNAGIINTGDIIINTDTPSDTVTINVPFQNGIYSNPQGGSGRVHVRQGNLALNGVIYTTNQTLIGNGVYTETNANGNIQWPQDIWKIGDELKMETKGNTRIRYLQEIEGTATNRRSGLKATGEVELYTNLTVKQFAYLEGTPSGRVCLMLNTNLYIKFEPYSELRGDTVIEGNVINDGGTFSGGNSPGQLLFTEGLQIDSGRMVIEIAGPDPGQQDTLVVSNTARLGGTLAPRLIDGYEPTNGAMFTFLTAGSITNTFDEIDSSGIGGRYRFEVTYSPTTVVLTAFTTNYPTYPSWRDNVFTASQQTNPAISNPEIDFDGDGLANVYEYVYGTRAGVPDENPMRYISLNNSTNPAGNEWIVRYPFANDVTDVSVVFEETIDINTGEWSAVASEIQHTQSSGTVTWITRRVPVGNPQRNHVRSAFELLP